MDRLSVAPAKAGSRATALALALGSRLRGNDNRGGRSLLRHPGAAQPGEIGLLGQRLDAAVGVPRILVEPRHRSVKAALPSLLELDPGPLAIILERIGRRQPSMDVDRLAVLLGILGARLFEPLDGLGRPPL